MRTIFEAFPLLVLYKFIVWIFKNIVNPSPFSIYLLGAMIALLCVVITITINVWLGFIGLFFGFWIAIYGLLLDR